MPIAPLSRFRAAPQRWMPRIAGQFGLTCTAGEIWLAGAFLVFALPVLRALWVSAWSTPQGAQGPIVLVSGIWLLTRAADHQSDDANRQPGWTLAATAVLAALLVLYVVTLITGFAAFAWAALIGVAVVALYLMAGKEAVATRWFAFAYLLFAAPVPTRLVAPFVNALSTWLSAISVDLLWFAGVDASRSGLDLYIDQYELRMADACAGLNSLTSLFAIGMFYIYVRHRARWHYALALCLLVPPIAVLANLTRILLLLLVTHFWGDGMAQGVLHAGAGMLMFLVALVALLAVDTAFSKLRVPDRLRA